MAGKAGRKGNGEGNLRQRTDGRWEARLTLSDGRTKSVYASTRQEAARKLAKLLRDRDEGAVIAHDERQTLRQYLASWLETSKRTVKPRTWLRYEQAIRTHILPGLGSVRLAKLNAQQVQRFYAAKLAEGLAESTVAHLHAVLHRALDAAERLDAVPRNVASLATPPRAKRHDIHILTRGQAQTLLRGVQGDRLEALYVLALTTGARQGELLALRWRDVDLDAGVVQIGHTLRWGASGRWYLETPKTARSRRRIELERVTIEALRSHRRRQVEERLAAGAAWQDHDLIFTNVIGDPLRGTHLLERHFLPLVTRLGLPRVRWHDLRHTAVSLAIEAGVPINVISQMIGHSTTSMTLDVYAHILPGQERAASRALEAALFGGLGSAHGSSGQM